MNWCGTVPKTKWQFPPTCRSIEQTVTSSPLWEEVTVLRTCPG